jgi:hypothetical protein
MPIQTEKKVFQERKSLKRKVLFQQKQYNSIGYWLLDLQMKPSSINKDYVNELINEMKVRIKMLVNRRSQKVIFKKITKHKYDKRKINEVLDKLTNKKIEELYDELLKNDKAKKKCNMGYNKTNKYKIINTKKNKTRKITFKKSKSK